MIELKDYNTIPDIIPAPDQTAKADAGKAKLSLVPTGIILAIARIREYGNNKYPEGGKDNWKKVDPDRYLDAACRHLLAVVRYGLDSKDEESGMLHLWHCACNLAFLIEMVEEKR